MNSSCFEQLDISNISTLFCPEFIYYYITFIITKLHDLNCPLAHVLLHSLRALRSVTIIFVFLFAQGGPLHRVIWTSAEISAIPLLFPNLRRAESLTGTIK